MAVAMNVCAVDFPPDTRETAHAGLTLAPSLEVAVPRIAEAPFALECRRTVSLAFGPHRELLIGEVVRLHAREGLIDPDRLRVTDAYRPVGRLFGDGYARQRDRFATPLDVAGLDEPFPAAFIRAPAIADPGTCEVLARVRGRPVAVRQGSILATAFHPELTDDSRIHRLAFFEAPSISR
ncbi:MAG: hypothetical protein QXG03_03165 [Halalkalicoccus sp.]